MSPLEEIIQGQERHAENGGEFAGCVIWWDVQVAGITTGDLKDLAQRVGLPSQYLPSTISPISAYKRSLQKIPAWLTGQKLKLIPIKEDGGAGPEIVHGVCQIRVDVAAEEAGMDQITTLRFDKATHRISCGNSDLEALMQEKYGRSLLHSEDDIRGIIVAVTRQVGISLRKAGGTYWVPAQHQELVNAVTNLAAGISINNKVSQLPLYESDSVTSTLTDAAQYTLENELSSLQKDLEQIQLGGATPRAVASQMVEIEKVRARVNLFAGVLNFTTSGLELQLGRIENDIRRVVGLPVAIASQQESDEPVITTTSSASPEEMVPQKRFMVATSPMGF